MRWRSREHLEQVAVADFFGNALKSPTYWTGIDHANAKSKAAAGLRKARGVKAGIADFFISHPAPGGHTLVIWLEQKAEAGVSLTTGKRVAAGRPSKEQNAFRDAVLATGAKYFIFERVEDTIPILEHCGIPLHATLLPSGGILINSRTGGVA